MSTAPLNATSPELLARLGRRRAAGKRLAIVSSGFMGALVLLACMHVYLRQQDHGRWLAAQELVKSRQLEEDRWRSQLVEIQAAYERALELKSLATVTQVDLLGLWHALPLVIPEDAYWTSVAWQPTQMDWEGIAAKAGDVEQVQRDWRDCAHSNWSSFKVSLLEVTPTSWSGVAFRGDIKWRRPHAR